MVLSLRCNGSETISDGNENIPCLVFVVDDYKLYMPYFELVSNLDVKDFHLDNINRLLFRFANSLINFLVVDIDKEMKVAFVSKLQADALEKEQFVEKYGIITELDTVTGTIMSVSRKNIVVNLFGLNKVIWDKHLPNVSSKNLALVFKSGQKVECKLYDMQYDDDFKSLVDAKISIRDYPTIPKDNIELLDGSFYFGEINSIRKNNTGVLVDCNGNSVFCEYPTDFIPVVGMGATVKIIRRRQNRENSYIGKVCFCEMPIGSY